MKKKNSLILIILSILIIFIFTKDFFIKTAITTVGSNIIGAPIYIKSFSSSILAQNISIKDLKMYNPEGFPKDILVDIPEVTVKFNFFDILMGKLHFPLIVLNLREVVIIKDKDGNLNVDALKIAKTEPEKSEKKSKKVNDKQFKIQIDLLKLNLERVVVEDFTKGTPPRVEVYETPLKNKEFKDIKSIEQLASLIFVQALSSTAIQGAKIFGAATILGVGFLPAGIAGVLIAKDSVTYEFEDDFYEIFDESTQVIGNMGEIKSSDKQAGIIKAKVEGCDIALSLQKTRDKKIKIIISARKFLVPKPEIAGGILRNIQKNLK